MDVEILYRPAYSMGVLKLNSGEEIQVEGGSMLGMSPEVTIETHAAGGILKSLARSLLGGESFFMNRFRAPAGGGEVFVAPPLPGDLVDLDLRAENLLVQSGAFVASESTIAIDTKWGGAKTFFASEGLVLLNLSGTGKLLLSSYGAIHEMYLQAGEKFIVDTGHLVAFSQNMPFNVRAVGGIKSTLFSGEGLVVEIGGPGRLLMQTRSSDAFLSWLIPKLPKPNHTS
jgi:uncharacterized protein (TIGR00266 family)